MMKLKVLFVALLCIPLLVVCVMIALKLAEEVIKQKK